MKILISACLPGVNCKYDGGNNFLEPLMSLLKGHELHTVCPEVLGGLVWRFENGVFTTTAAAARTALGWLITLGYQRDVYLTVSGGSLAASLRAGAAATFLKPVAE